MSRSSRIATLTLIVACAAAGCTEEGDAPTSPEGEPGVSRNEDGTAAEQLILWADYEGIVDLSDDQLDTYAEMGVDGLVLSAGRLKGAGGSQEWTADPRDPLSGEAYSQQRLIRDSDIVSRAADRGIDLYLGYKVANPYNDSTPYVDWFDDAAWETVTESIGDFAGAAHMLGFKGIAVDQELYQKPDSIKHDMWKWDYPGNTHTKEQVREKVEQRGEQAAQAALAAFPDLEWAVYNFLQDNSWFEVKYEELGFAPEWEDRVDIDWWDGVAGVEGYAAIRQWNNVFYKTPWPAQGESDEEKWENGMLWDVSQTAALLSRRLEHWGYAHSRYFSSPFVWITEGPRETTSDDARPPDDVATQLTAARKFGMGGGFANYSYGGLTDTDAYAPYADVIQAASSPGDVDSTAPSLEVSGGSTEISGTAHDNLAIWAVRWKDDLGGSGAAELAFTVTDGDRLNIEEWRMDWAIPTDELTDGATSVTIVAEDIKENESKETIELD